MMDCTLLGVLVLVVIAASLCESWCLRRRIAELEDEVDDEMWWALEYCHESVRNRRRAERYHDHALRERDRANRLEAELDEAMKWDARRILESAIDAELDGV